MEPDLVEPIRAIIYESVRDGVQLGMLVIVSISLLAQAGAAYYVRSTLNKNKRVTTALVVVLAVVVFVLLFIAPDWFATLISERTLGDDFADL